MISTDSRMTDKEDVAVLFLAMCKFGEENDIIEMASVGFGAMLSRAERAAEVIAERHKDEGDRWDGDLWLERLEDTDEESLAAKLFMLYNQEGINVVSITTVLWLKGIGAGEGDGWVI